MKRLIISILLLTFFVASKGQTYNNEWINYNSTYYKFKVGANGLYRITQPQLAVLGLSTTPVQHFQLWKNGIEVPMFTTISTGTLTVSDYLEFFGTINDGKQDTRLYKFDSLQMSDNWSLYTDTAAYFLTVNSVTANKRLTDPGNNVAGNVLAAETFFNYTLSKYYKDFMSSGYGVNLGEIVHSASYETAEGWSSNPVNSSGALSAANNGLNVYTSGPAASFSATIAGNTASSRTVNINLNGNAIGSPIVDGYNINRFTNNNINLSLFTGGAATISFALSGSASDNFIVSHYQLTYPRTYNFGGQTQFRFQLPASSEKYLEITNFNLASGGAVLYDLTNNLRITGNINAGVVRIVLPASATTRNLVLLSTGTSQINAVNSFTTRNFIPYNQLANQGDYLIISSPLLFNDGLGNNQVELYRQYRSSAAGGSYTAKLIEMDQLTDQFGYGIKHHPIAIRNFSAFALANFTVQPKFLFMIGKGLNYQDFRRNENDPNVNRQAMIPTFGKPSSDNLLTASRTGWFANIPTGRLSAITGAEVGIYLSKMKQFELAQASSDQTIASKAWMKNIAQLTGGLDDPGLYGLITSYMQGYESIASDSLFGGKVFQFSKNTGSSTAVGSTKTMTDLFSEGLSIINYFGHSSPNNIEFNLDNPQNYNNTGKYPLIIINGCNSGDLFTFDTLRAVSSGTLSEKFVFANQKGSIGYIASTHYGLPTQLNYFNTGFYSNLSKAMYGQPIGNIMKATMQTMSVFYLNDYIAETHAEEITLHADPALRLNPHSKPDFIINDSLLNFNPTIVSVADQTMTITSKIVNIGKAVNDSLTIKVQHRLPNNDLVLVGTYRIKAVLYEDSVVTTLYLNPLLDKGYNEIIVTIDPDNIVSEISKANNTVTKGFTILEDDIRPIWPYEYSIVNNATDPVFASTANPTATSKQYVMEMDTTMYFNSPFKISKLVSDSGGVIQFIPGFNYTDSTVYYWRVGVAPATSNTPWRTSSFVYINSASTGFNQSHYFQYKNNQYSSISLDSNSRKFIFDDKERRLLIRTGLYPYYGWDQINVNVDDDQIDYYGCKYKALQFVVYDPLTLQPWKNVNNGAFGRFGSGTVCDQYSGTYRNFFEFPYDDTSYRRKAMQFFDSIPNGYYVSITNLGWIYNTNYFIDAWKSDTIRLGSGKSLWHKFHEMGMHRIDEFTQNLPFVFVFRKGDTLDFPVKQVVGAAANVQISETFYLPGKKVEGTIVTPWLGPAKIWDRLKWKENFRANATTSKRFDIIGKNIFGGESIIASVTNAQDTTISFINATTYPYLKMQLYNKDDQQAQTTDLRNWMLTGTQVPEGAIAPNLAFMFQDTVAINDTLRFKVAFKNASTVNFDSIKLKLTITDKDGIAHIYDNLQNGARLRPLPAGDSVLIEYNIPMAGYFGNNELKLEVNPDNDQPEQFLFNNFLFKKLIGINASICSGSSPTFVSGAHVIGNGYQWQVDDGNGFVDISDNALYTGTLTRTLLLNNVPSSMYGYKYRCEISNNGVVTYCPDFVLKFAMNWTGAVSTEWENPANWSCNAIPDQYTDVNINSELIRYPVINSVAVCRSIRAKLGSRVTVNSGFSLLITGLSL